MILIDHFNDHIPGNTVHLVSGIGIHGNLIVILIQRISVRRCDFLNPVMPDCKILRQDQIAFLVRKERGMNLRCRISRHLLNVFFIVQVIDPELRAFLQYRLFRLIILLDDFQLRFKFFVQKHPPYLGRVRTMLRDPHDKIIHRLVIMGRGCLTDKVGTIRKGNAAGMAFLVRKHLCRSILPDHHRFCGIKIIAAIFFYRQIRKKICCKSGTGKQIGVRLPVIGCFDNFKGLLLYLFQ